MICVFEFNVYKPSMGNLASIPEEDLAWDYYYRLYYDDEDEFVPPENQNYIYTTPMEEGGEYPTDTTEKTPLMPGGGGGDEDDNAADNPIYNADLSQQPIPDEDKEDWRQFASNTTGPQASSTPGGDNIQMATRMPTEKQGASGDTTETSFTTGFDQGHPITLQNKARREIAGEFPNADFTQLEFRYKEAPKSGGQIIVVNYHTSDKEYPLYTKSRGDAEKTLNTSLPKRIKDALGKSVTEELNETNAQLQELQDQEKAQRKALQQAETKAAEAQRLRREMDAIRDRTTDISARMQQLENTHGPLDKDAIQKLKDEKRSLETDHQEKRKQLDAAAKSAKQAQKLQQDINKTRLSKGETERRLGKLKAQKDTTQAIDKIKQKIAELNEHNAEDIRLMEDENTLPSERTAARERVAVRNEELEMLNEAAEDRERQRSLLNEEVEDRERQRPLPERVKEIFKKYGWTLQAVVLAVGLVLGALALAGLNGLKAGTNAVGQGLQVIGKKLGSLLPGLIGSIVSFIFKAAGQVFSFLTEHAWLLILTVVAFFMARLLKKRRKQ